MTNLIKVIERRKKRVGRGAGSGKGFHTSGRGQKGQKSRGKIGILFEGMKVKKSLLKRLPLRRGKGKFRHGQKPVIISAKKLEKLPVGSTIDLKLLVKENLIDEKTAKKRGVKILGVGKNEKKFKFLVPVSKTINV
jgi:large subunit ribosomal protein L15